MKLGIDIGNYNVKTSEGALFKSCISNHMEYGNNFDKIIYNDETYYLGTGKLEIDYRKFDKENYIPLLLGAICKSSTHIENDIGLGLPVKQYNRYKNELINMLHGNEYDVVFNNNKRKIKISDVKVFPESVSGIIANYNELLSKIGNRDIISIDIGGKTTDIVLIRNKKVMKSSQINIGTIDIYNRIKQKLEEKYFDTKIILEDIERFLKIGFYYNGEKQDIKFAIKDCNDLFKEIYTELNLNYPINSQVTVIQGGGSDLLGSVFKNKIKSLIVNENIFLNANGYKMLLK